MKAQIGTISHGTLRDDDLLEAFADELERLGGDEDLVTEARELLDPTYMQELKDEEAPEMIESLIGALNEFAPDYCYFGTNEGDGSDFGFWPSIDSIESDARDGELLKVSDLSEIPEGHNGSVVLVNDHGNMTLYAPDITYKEVWSIV